MIIIYLFSLLLFFSLHKFQLFVLIFHVHLGITGHISHDNLVIFFIFLYGINVYCNIIYNYNWWWWWWWWDFY
jgi:hypothetical protein